MLATRQGVPPPLSLSVFVENFRLSIKRHVTNTKHVTNSTIYRMPSDALNKGKVKVTPLYPSPNIVRVIKSRRMRWAGHVARMEEGRGVHKVLVGKPEGQRRLGRPRRRWEDNIKMDLQEVGGGCGDWMELYQDRDRWRALVSTVMNFRVP